MGEDNNRNKIMFLIIYFVVLIPVLLFGLLISPVFFSETLKGAKGLEYIVHHPFTLVITKDSLKATIVLVMFYTAGFGIFYIDRVDKRFRRGREHGDAKWGNPKKIGKELSDPNSNKNIILTKNVSVYCDDRVKHMNIVCTVMGSMGQGKSRFVVIPTLMQMIGSYIVLDPKGELLETTGKMLAENGYRIKVFNLIDTSNSDFFNPFVYIKNDQQLYDTATSLFKDTTPPDSVNNQDPFFEQMAETLLRALMFVVYYEAVPSEMNLASVMFLLDEIDVREEDENYKSWVHLYFEQLERQNPKHPALSPWKSCSKSAGRTFKSIIVSLQSHLNKLSSVDIQNITRIDNMELERTGEEKTAIFLEISDKETSFNFLVSMFYTSLIRELFRVADEDHKKDGHRLPEYTLIMMDELANVAVPQNFTNILTTARSRNIGIMMFLQDQNQLKTSFKDNAPTIISSSDEILYLGSQSKETMEYFSEMLGEETIDLESFGTSKGQSESSSTNQQTGGLKLATIAQIRKMPYDHCLLLLKGKDGVYDYKYDPTKHPNAHLTTITGGVDRKYINDLGRCPEVSASYRGHKEIQKYYEQADNSNINIIDLTNEVFANTDKIEMFDSEESCLEYLKNQKAE